MILMFSTASHIDQEGALERHVRVGISDESAACSRLS